MPEPAAVQVEYDRIRAVIKAIVDALPPRSHSTLVFDRLRTAWATLLDVLDRARPGIAEASAVRFEALVRVVRDLHEEYEGLGKKQLAARHTKGATPVAARPLVPRVFELVADFRRNFRRLARPEDSYKTLFDACFPKEPADEADAWDVRDHAQKLLDALAVDDNRKVLGDLGLDPELCQSRLTLELPKLVKALGTIDPRKGEYNEPLRKGLLALDNSLVRVEVFLGDHGPAGSADELAAQVTRRQRRRRGDKKTDEKNGKPEVIGKKDAKDKKGAADDKKDAGTGPDAIAAPSEPDAGSSDAAATKDSPK